MVGLTGKTALVTGAAGGIGAEYARRLTSLGATVFVADLDETGAKHVAEEIGPRAIGTPLDVTDELSIGNAVRLAADHGGLDVLINNAAIYKGLKSARPEEITAAEFRRVLDVNVTGVFLMCKAFIGQLRASRGVIVNQASTAAYAAGKDYAHYCASKAAVVSFTRSLAADVGPDGVRVNAIAPGLTTTEATLSNFPGRDQAYGAVAALRRAGTPEDLCGTLEFLVSRESAWMTGQTLVVDGGQVFPQ
jgi:NAD(P)-dependent dehydrogenase (short-subunit alcohol dehydrogenase family)